MTMTNSVVPSGITALAERFVTSRSGGVPPLLVIQEHIFPALRWNDTNGASMTLAYSGRGFCMRPISGADLSFSAMDGEKDHIRA